MRLESSVKSENRLFLVYDCRVCVTCSHWLSGLAVCKIGICGLAPPPDGRPPIWEWESSTLSEVHQCPTLALLITMSIRESWSTQCEEMSKNLRHWFLQGLWALALDAKGQTKGCRKSVHSSSKLFFNSFPLFLSFLSPSLPRSK